MDQILIDLPLPITTPRLILRPVQAGEGPAITEAKRESWAELSPWDIWTWGRLEDLKVEDDELFCRRKYIKFLAREDLTFLSFNRETGKLIGVAGLHKCDWKRRMFMVGFWVRTSETAKGYATEAGNALIRYAFDALSATKVYSFHAAGNVGSQRVIEKLGFQHEGVLRNQGLLGNGAPVDEIHYGLLDLSALPPLEVNWG
jgi:RimJ/RimL family protein N-acetyltransferase